MKLHLPVGLRAALLAVLLCSPVAMGNVKVYQGVNDDGTGGMEVIPMDGEIDSYESGDGWSFFGDVVITVDGETTGGDGLTDLTYSGNTGNCRTTITVESGGTFTCQSGSMIGTATDYASPPIESETIFNVSGGTVNLGSVGVGVVSDNAANARSSVIFNISENGQVLSSSSSIGGINGDSSNHSEVTMNLTSGGKLKIGSTTFGGKFGLVENTDSSSVVTISVDGENSSVELGAPSIGNVSAANSTSVVDIDVTQHGSFKLLSDKEGSEGNYSSGSIGTVSSADSHSDVYITVAGEGSLFEIASYWQTIGTVSTSKGGVQHLGSSTTKIEVREGGVFTHKMGDVGLNKSTAATPKGGSAATTELMLTVDGGTYNMGFCDDRQGSHLGGVGTPATDIHGKNTTEIHVQNNGQFNFKAKRGYIGASYNDGSDVTLNIFLDKGGVFSFERYEDDDTKSQVETHIGYACGGNVNFTLDVGADSKFSVLPQSKAQQIDQSIGAAQAYLNTTSEVSAKVDIYLHDGGTMDFRPTTITSFSGVHFAGIGISYGKSDKKVSAATSITVGNKDQQTETEGMSEGAASTFNFGGGDIGLAWVSGDGKVENTAAITVNEGGTFTMTGGRLGYVNVSSKGKGTVKQDLSLTLNGGDMMITGGSILASEAGRTAGTSERTASIELSGDSVLTIGNGVTIGSDVTFAVTMHGGKLAGDGISKLKGDVTIDTGEGFTGTIGLGGIGAERIKQVRINSGDIADIGEGTLTLDAEDILTVGEKNVWKGRDVSPAPEGKQALLQFKTEGSGSPSEMCTVDVDGKVTLNFDGQYLAKQKGEDGSVSLRVWITNGKLAVAEEGSEAWAKEHFTIGTGWGLEVKTYDADQGMLILEGTSTVWVATVDGDKENTGRATANASALEEYTKVIVDEGTTFTADEDATIQQLEGRGEGSQLELVKGTEGVTITLNNVDKERGDTVFESSISAEEGVNLRKEGDASFTVQGTLQAEGDVTVAQGTLTLGDGENSISGALTVGDAESGTSGTLDVQGNLSAKGAVNVAAGELVLEGDNNTVAGALSMGTDGTLQVEKALTLSGESDLTAGTLTGEGTITVARENGSLTVGEGVKLGKDLSLQVDGNLTLCGEQQRGTEEGKGAITGSGTLIVAEGGKLSTGSHLDMGISGIDVKGTLSQEDGQISANRIVVEENGEYKFQSGKIDALKLQDDTPGTLNLQVEGTFAMSGGDMAKGGDTSITVDENGEMTVNGKIAEGGKADITVGTGGNMVINSSGKIAKSGGEAIITVEEGGNVNMVAGDIGYASDSPQTKTTINVKGGTFETSGASSIGNVYSFSDGSSSEVTINVSGGQFNLAGNGQVGVVTGGRNEDKYGPAFGDECGIEINVTGGEFVLDATGNGIGAVMGVNGSAKTTIHVGGENGAFTMKQGHIGYASVWNVSTGGGSTTNTIIVDGHGKFDMQGGDIGKKDGSIASLLQTTIQIKLSEQGQMAMSGGEIGGGTFTLSGSATMEQTGGQITGSTFTLNDNATLTQSNGTIDGGSITLSGGATMEQTGGEITGGTLDLSGGAKLTQSDSGTINGGSITLSGEGTGFTQAGGSIGEDATFSLKDGAKLTLKDGSMNAAVTMEGEASSYDLGNQAAKGDIIMKGGSLANAENYAGSLAIWTDATYTGSLDLGGVDAARITQVQIGASGTELRNLKSGSTLTFREGDEMVVGVQHVYREGQTEPTGESMVQFQGEKGQIAFDGDSALRLHLKSEVLKGLEGQMEILFTNGSFSGMPEGGQKELEEWLSKHFVLDAGLEDIEILLLNDAKGGHLILTGSTSGIWIASRNGQNVDVADLLNNYSAVIADEELTLTLPPTREETLTIVNQLQNERETHGDFIVKTESGATANHTVQLHNANTNGDNGGTEFYGSIRVEGTGLEAATLEKTGDATLNVHGNVESSGTVQVKEGTLALGGTANSIGTLAMSGGKLQVDGALALTGATEMSEESHGSISGTGNVKIGSGASLTLAGGVSYEVQNTQLENGAQMSQKGEAAIKGGSIALSGKGTGYTQAGGTISGTTFTLTEGTSFTQAGGSIGEGATFSLSDGATLTLSGGSMNGAVTMEGKTSLYDLGNQAAGGSITMRGGSLANAGNYAGSLVIQTGDTYTGALDLGGMDAARITSIQLAGKDTYLTGLKEGSTLTLHADDNFKVTEQNAWVDGKGGPEGKQAFFQFGTAGAGEVGTGSVVDVESGAIITLDFVGKQIAEAVGEDGGITLKVWITNGQLGGGKTGEAAVTWAKEHFVIGTGWGLDVESYDAAQGMLVLKGQSNIWDAKVNGDQVADHAEANASELDLAEKVIIDENTVVAVDQNATIHQLDGEGKYSLRLKNDGGDDKTITLNNQGTSESALGSAGDTVFGGDILAGDGVNLQKTGDAALKVQGSLKAEGNVAVEEGKLAIGGNDSSIDGTLSLGDKENDKRGELQVDGKLTLSQEQNLDDSQGSITGNGTVVLDGDFTVGDVGLGKDLTFQMGKAKSADFGNNAVTLQNLEGEKEVTAREGVTLTGEGSFSGIINGDTTVQGKYALSGANIDGTLDNGGAGGTGSTLKIASGDSSAGAQITVNGNIVFRRGAETDFTINLSDPGLWTENIEEHDATMLSTEETIYIENGTKFVIDCSQKGISDAKGDLTHVVILKGKSIEEVEKYDALEKNSGANRQAVYAASAGAAYAMQTRAAEEQPEEQHQVERAQVEGGVLFNQLYETPTMWTNGTESWIDAKHRTMSPLANLATTSNSMSGLRLLWQDLNDKGLTQATQQVSEILALLDNLAATNPAAARQMMAAVAGSTLTSLSSAQNAALRNQMSRVRDHALQAARLRGGEHPENGQENVVTDPKGVTVRTAQQTLSSGSTTHAWIEGTSFFSEQHSVGDESGYRLNSLGGAVGVDKQLADNWSVGAYLSASYGDLEARAAEYAKGDMDTYAVGVWGQNHTGRWGNTLLALWAWNDASLRRMVNNGAGYAGRSDADGYSIGAQWELTYDLYMNEEKTNVLQPLFGVAVMRTEMDGFSEKGAGSLGLNVKDQTRDTVTLALGARWLATIGSGKAINRTVNTELHANVAQDLGDRRSDADVALQANPTYIRNVRGAKAGSTALQFGAGVNVPMTPNSQIYVNAGGELREHASSWNAALGVRMGF